MQIRFIVSLLILLLLLSSLALIVIHKAYRIDSQTKINLTKSSLEKKVKILKDILHASKAPLPERINSIMDSPLTDLWGNEIKYKRIDGATFSLSSAGLDGKFNTNDDLVEIGTVENIKDKAQPTHKQ